MKKLHFEYGHGTMEASVPDSTDVFIYGETVKDPDALKDPIEATKQSILNPTSMKPISESVKQGDKCVIVFPDKVKGGFQETSHRKISIRIILDELISAGVNKSDIKLICSNGLHRKNTPDELKKILGEAIFNEYYWSNQIVNHDSEDWNNLIDLGTNKDGDKVVMNKEVYDSDFCALVGHVMGNPYGAYSGTYKHCATGITNWECIASHHVPRVMHRDDFVPIRNENLMARKFNAIGQYMEEKMGKKFFCCDAVLDSQSQQIAIYTGYAADIQRTAWECADKRTYVKYAEEKYDIMLFGMPQNFHYGNGHGTNPLLMMQAIAANIIRHRGVMNDKFVIICSSLCNGYFHDEEFPSYRPLYELFQTNYANQLPDVNLYLEEFARDEAMINKYRYGYGYHPFHAFSMTSCGHIVEMNTLATYIVGAQEPGYARSMGCKTRATFEEALEDAKRYVGSNPRILALPECFKRAAVHLKMKD